MPLKKRLVFSASEKIIPSKIAGNSQNAQKRFIVYRKDLEIIFQNIFKLLKNISAIKIYVTNRLSQSTIITLFGSNAIYI